MLLFALAIAVAAGAAWRAKHIRDLTRLSMLRRRLGPDGIVIGGEGFVYDRANAPAVLLLHGGGDTPQTLRYLAGDLHARGFHVSAPLLPGHGRTVRDFGHISAARLIDATRANYRELRATHDWVAVIGLSMGGSLAVHLATETPDLPALGLVAPYFAMPARIQRAARVAWLWGPVVPVVRSGDGFSILDPAERERSLAYGVFTAAALRTLYDLTRTAVAQLPRVVAPTLMVQSRGDNRIAAADAERAFNLIGAQEKRLDWITGAAHVITVDYGHERVSASLVAWMESHAPIRSEPT
jgi:carboxylesterase